MTTGAAAVELLAGESAADECVEGGGDSIRYDG